MKKLISLLAIFLMLPVFAFSEGMNRQHSLTLTPRSDETNALVINNTDGTAKITVNNAGVTTIGGAVTLSGGATLSGANTISGATAVSGAQTNTGKKIMTPTVATLSATGSITLAGSFMVISSTGNPVICTTTAIISTATATNPNGTWCVLAGGSDTDLITLTDSAVFALGAGTRALGVGDILELIIYNGIWYEVGFTNN